MNNLFGLSPSEYFNMKVSLFSLFSCSTLIRVRKCFLLLHSFNFGGKKIVTIVTVVPNVFFETWKASLFFGLPLSATH